MFYTVRPLTYGIFWAQIYIYIYIYIFVFANMGNPLGMGVVEFVFRE